MTAFLASVSSLDEARLVADIADVVDLKDPAAGALGALDRDRVREIVRWSEGRHVLSAALGDLPMRPQLIADACAAMAASGIDFVKIGLFANTACRECIYAAAVRCPGAALVGVLFADQAPDLALLDDMASAGFAGVMLDTADKRRGTLLDAMTERTLSVFVSRAHALGLFAGLAGSLRADDLPAVLRCSPDFVGFRGALCEGHARRGSICRDRALALAAQVGRAGDRASALNRLRRAHKRGVRSTQPEAATHVPT
jgi:(5-formylfuran-3-yl)methyl phosphate synthase